MDRRPASVAARWGAWLLAGGLGLLAVWAALEFSPLGVVEEPASPGKTPNPSRSPWDKPIPGFEYKLAHGLVLLVDYVLPVGGSLAAAVGLGLIVCDARSRSGRPGRVLATSLLGVFVLLCGLSLVGTTVWQWHVRTQPMSPASPGSPGTMDPDSPFFGDLSDWTPHKSDAYWDRMRRRDRIDRLWWRTVLYVFPPVGLLLAGIGVWILAADHRRPGGSPA